MPGNQDPEAPPRQPLGNLEAEPPDLCYHAEPGNKQYLTGSPALPGNQDPEALPRQPLGNLEAEPPDLCYHAEPGNKQY
ncbi:hypothetical protein [Microcoleus sp.]|uniref:hypothetical protein n=1 Tax=Microcoleus sp. TaxID=44472 RepID=UPI0035238BCF